MRLPGAPRPSRISSRGAAAFARVVGSAPVGGAPAAGFAPLATVLAVAVALATALPLAAALAAHARADVLPLGPAGGTSLCSGRSGPRAAFAALPDGAGGWLIVTRDPAADPFNPPDGGDDLGLLHLSPALAPLPVNDAPGGSDPCGAPLLGGAGDQSPFAALALGPARNVVVGRELSLDDTWPHRVFAMGFDDHARPLFPDVIATPADPLAFSDFPFAAPDGMGGLFLGWVEATDVSALQGRVLVAHLDASGRPLWPAPVAVSTTLRAMSFDATASPDGAGGVFVTWLEPFPGDLDGYQPRLQHLDAAGAPTLHAGGVRVDPAHRISGAVLLAPWRPPSLTTATVATAATSGVIALAVAEVPRAHLILADGTRPWGGEGLPLMPGLAGLRPGNIGFAGAPDGSLRVTWVETDGGTLDRLVARRLDPDGQLPWPDPVPLLETTLLLQRSESVLPDGALVVAAAVHAPDLPEAPADLVAQVVDARGRTKTAVAGFDLCRADRRQWNPVVLASPAGTTAVIWSDNRAGNSVDGADAYYTQSLVFTTAPRLTTPATLTYVRQGDERIMVVDGDDLVPGLTATLGPGIEVTSAVVEPLHPDGPGDRLRLTLRALPHAAVGGRTLTITNPDGSAAAVPSVLAVVLDPARIDIDGSGRADGFDLALLASSFGRAAGEPGYSLDADIDGSGLVDGVDLALLAGRFGGRAE